MRLPSDDERHELGYRGESAAADLLKRHGLRIVARRFRTPLGEIDLIAKERDCWVFVEVKTRFQAYAIAAVEAIDRRRRQRLVNAALVFMKKHRLVGQDMRFDAVLIEGNRLEWIRDAFRASSRYFY